jgi:hypothetical protein
MTAEMRTAEAIGKSACPMTQAVTTIMFEKTSISEELIRRWIQKTCKLSSTELSETSGISGMCSDQPPALYAFHPLTI